LPIKNISSIITLYAENAWYFIIPVYHSIAPYSFRANIYKSDFNSPIPRPFPPFSFVPPTTEKR
jgi:hypothetical protein